MQPAMGDSHAAKFKGRMIEHASLKAETVPQHVAREKHERLNLWSRGTCAGEQHTGFFTRRNWHEINKEKQHLFTDPKMFKEASSAEAHNSVEFVTGQLKPPSKAAAGIFPEEPGGWGWGGNNSSLHLYLWCACVKLFSCWLLLVLYCLPSWSTRMTASFQPHGDPFIYRYMLPIIHQKSSMGSDPGMAPRVWF